MPSSQGRNIIAVSVSLEPRFFDTTAIGRLFDDPFGLGTMHVLMNHTICVNGRRI